MYIKDSYWFYKSYEISSCYGVARTSLLQYPEVIHHCMSLQADDRDRRGVRAGSGPDRGVPGIPAGRGLTPLQQILVSTLAC